MRWFLLSIFLVIECASAAIMITSCIAAGRADDALDISRK